MGLLGNLFGSGDSKSESKTESTTQTNTGSGLAASGITGNVTYVSNDPAAAVASLNATAYTVKRSLDTVDRSLDTADKAVKGSNDIATNTISGALKAVGDTVTSANGVLEKTQQLYYEKLADNAGVAPQTLQQQQQAASADITKTVALVGALLLSLLFLSRNDVAKTVITKASK